MDLWKCHVCDFLSQNGRALHKQWTVHQRGQGKYASGLEYIIR